LRGLPAWVLKGSAVCLTVLAAVGSASYVGGHVKNPSAPLRPPLHPQTGLSAAGDARGQVNLPPGLRTTASGPVTETHVS